MLLKSILLTSFIMINHLSFFGQPGFPYDQQWKIIDSLINEKNLPQSALKEVHKVYEGAKRERNEAQWIKAVIYINHLEDTRDKDITVKIEQLQDEILAARGMKATIPPQPRTQKELVPADEADQHSRGGEASKVQCPKSKV